MLLVISHVTTKQYRLWTGIMQCYSQSKDSLAQLCYFLHLHLFQCNEYTLVLSVWPALLRHTS